MPRGIPRAGGQSSYDSKTNEPASLRRSRFQGRTLTSTWGKSRGWLKGVNFQRRLIHVLAPLTSFRRCFGCVPFPAILTLLFRLLENGLSSVEIPSRKLIGWTKKFRCFTWTVFISLYAALLPEYWTVSVVYEKDECRGYSVGLNREFRRCPRIFQMSPGATTRVGGPRVSYRR